ncbi:MAG: GntR family transcriptional regulator [Oscillospiraceae bacterium]
MQILISNTSGEPLYEQIENQIKSAILAGAIAQGEQLPSIRFLAKELRVSIITTKRAYENLEQQGFIKTVQGKGTFVSLDNLERLREISLAQIEEELDKAVTRAKSIGMPLSQLYERLSILYGEDSEDVCD